MADGAITSGTDASSTTARPTPVPAEEPGHVDLTFTHVDKTAGTRPVTVSITSARYEGYRSPYSSQAEAAVALTVHP